VVPAASLRAAVQRNSGLYKTVYFGRNDDMGEAATCSAELEADAKASGQTAGAVRPH
jgi:hypothetical protein